MNRFGQNEIDGLLDDVKIDGSLIWIEILEGRNIWKYLTNHESTDFLVPFYLNKFNKINTYLSGVASNAFSRIIKYTWKRKND